MSKAGMDRRAFSPNSGSGEGLSGRGGTAGTLNGNSHQPAEELGGVSSIGGQVLLSVLVPTRNEIDGVGALLERLSWAALDRTEVLFVDDSNDGTAYRVRRLVEAGSWDNLTIRLVHRPYGRRKGGLGGAVCEGLRRASGEYVCVMDADLQHPPEIIAKLMAHAQERSIDLVVASRFAEGGGDVGLSPSRKTVSRACATAARVTFPRLLRTVSDPLSGFFLLRRDKVDPDELRPHGFKILLEILGRYPELTVGEVGYVFSERYAGASKTSFREGARYGVQLASLRAARLRRSPRAASRYFYDIHSVLTVASVRRLPELDKFRVRRLEAAPSIDVRVQRFKGNPAVDLIDLMQATPRIHYREALGRHGFVAEVETGDTTQVSVSPLVACSPHVLYTNVVEPLLRWHLVKEGYAFVHAACFADGEDVYLITARTDTGKTTTMLKLLAHSDYRFLSDDLVLVDQEGRVLAYPKPLTISNHTVHALNGAELDVIERTCLPLQSKLHSRSGRRIAFQLMKRRIPVATLNSVVQILVPPPKYHVERLVPGVPLGHSGRIAGIVVIERGEDVQRVLSGEEVLSTLIANGDDAFGFPPYQALERLMHGVSELDLRARERSIVASAVQGQPAYLMRNSTMGWAEQMQAVLEVMRDDRQPRKDSAAAEPAGRAER